MKLLRGLTFSIIIHGLLYAAGVGYLAWRTAQAGMVMEIDLLHSSLLQRPRSPRGLPRLAPSEPWVLTTGKRSAPMAPALKPPPPAAPPEEQTTDAEAQSGTGGAPEIHWFPAAAATRMPEWVDGLITEEDYPPAARKQGKEGRVMATVSIDAEGNVRRVEITEGSEPEFNRVVEERLRSARFRPARDENDNPIAVRMSIPIVFELH